jgi:hypothetical protein
MRRTIRNIAIATTMLVAAPALAAEAGMSIPMDEARVIAFKRPVQTVFVGNPMIADVNMIDSRHAFIMGKTFGSTNVIALDGNGNPVASQHVIVLGSSKLVTLNRGPDQFTYACATQRCEHSRVPGDPKIPFDDQMGEITARSDYSQKQADAAAGGVGH